MNAFRVGITGILCLISAVAYRIRGSGYFADLPPKFLFGLMRGDKLFKNLIGAFPVGVAVLLAGAPWYLAVVAWLLTTAVDTLPHGAFQGCTSVPQFLGLCGLGIAQALPASLALWSLWPVALGPLVGVAYLAGNKLPWPSFAIDKFSAAQGPDWGELLTGFVRPLFLGIV